jgi:acetoin utilization deacetylase AcuC-like enzyme
MSVAWIFSDDYLKHDTGKAHPERVGRLKAITSHFEETGLAGKLTRVAPTPATKQQITAVHDPMYVQTIEQTIRSGQRQIEADTLACTDSFDVAMLAAGGVINACDAVMTGQHQRVFCTVRPPGHHAEHDRAMGFCIFNNVAIAAQYLIQTYKLSRVAIVDFDVHHGNGTQHSFEDRADVLFISIHEDPRHLYPGTGFAEETDKGAGLGYTLNVPMAPGSGDDDYKRQFEAKILPKLDEYKPQMLLISAGFDAAKEDPLAHIELPPGSFDWMTRRLVEIADKHCSGRIVSTLEGGYDLSALARCSAAHVQALL